MIYFTADLHLNHRLMLKHRGFATLDAMHHHIIGSWNTEIKSEDEVYILGDVSMSNHALDILNQLNGKLYLVRGNHDTSRLLRQISARFEWVKDYYSLKTPHHIVLSHYPMLVWDRSHYGSWQLHGHCHGQLNAPVSTRLDVGWDVFKRPVSYLEVAEILSQRTYQKWDHH